MGFQPIAVYKGVGYKQGRWLDVGWWQLDLQPEVDNPPEPRPLPELQTSEMSRILCDAEQSILPMQTTTIEP